MGSVYKRGKYYYFDIRIEGKRIRKKVGTSKKVADLALKDIEVKVAKEEYDFSIPDITLKELFLSYFSFSEINHAKSTTKRYKNVITNFEIFLEVKYKNIKRVSQLNPLIFEKFKHFRKTIDPRTLKLPSSFPLEIKNNCFTANSRTLNFEIKTLRSILNYGIKNKLCRDNPCQNIPLLKVTDSKQPRFLTYKECKVFLENCGEKFYPIFSTYLNTGMRKSELINLEWNDIDFKRRKIKIQNKDFWEPKTGKREIPMSQNQFELLKKLKQINDKGLKSDFVFPHKDGGLIKIKLRDKLIEIAKIAKIKDLTKIHTLRHTFASHLVMKGVDLPTVKELLGHSDIQTTMIYAHLAPEHLADAVEKLEF